MFQLLKKKDNFNWIRMTEDDIMKGSIPEFSDKYAMELKEIEDLFSSIKYYVNEREVLRKVFIAKNGSKLVTPIVSDELIKENAHELPRFLGEEMKSYYPIFWQLFPKKNYLPIDIKYNSLSDYKPEKGEYPFFFVHRSHHIEEICKDGHIKWRNPDDDDSDDAEFYRGIFFHKFVPFSKAMDLQSFFYIYRDPNIVSYAQVGYIFPIEEIYPKYKVIFSGKMTGDPEDDQISFEEYANPYKYVEGEALVQTKSISIDKISAIVVKIKEEELFEIREEFSDAVPTLEEIVSFYQKSRNKHIVESYFNKIISYFYDESKENKGLPLLYATGPPMF